MQAFIMEAENLLQFYRIMFSTSKINSLFGEMRAVVKPNPIFLL